MEKVCVAVRVRPSASEEPASGIYWKIEKNRICLQKKRGSPIHGLTYAFDYVFDQDCANGTVYELLAKDIVHAAVGGFNGTAFAYGQTSSGKTFTMNGSEADPGIIHQAVKDVFQKIQQMVDREFLVRVSYMEIYNEEINDLFVIESQKLQIHESLERGVFVKGLKEEIVNNAGQVLKLIELGEANKHFGETNMNIRSSRSHTIFRMVIESKVKDHSSCNENLFTSDAIRVSVLNLVDLAGSERIAKTGVGGIRLKEGKHINKSLMILGNVINKLGDDAKQKGHIPYRDSKLTRILQPALGGNAKTSIICTMAPEEIHIEESKGTLQFASRAKHITNCVQVNEILTDAALLKRQKLEIEELRNKLQGSRAEVLEQEILKLRNEMLKYEQEREKLELELEEERKSRKYQRDGYNREQQLKDNLTNLATSLGSDQTLNQDQCSGDVFGTPCFKHISNSFVAMRSNYSRPPGCSPIPDTLSSIADEDTWSKMNNGFMTDLDLLEMTPARELQSFPCSDVTSGFSNKAFEDDTYDLKRELELVIQQRNDLETSLRDQIMENNQLKEEISGLRQERIPSPLLESIGKCKDVYEDVLSNMMISIADMGSSANKEKLLSEFGEVGSRLFSALEAQFSVTMKRHDALASSASSLLEEELDMLRMRLNTNISSLLSPESAAYVSAMSPREESTGKRRVAEVDKYDELEREFEAKSLLLEDFKERCHKLERESQTVINERNCLLQTVAESYRKFENVLKELNGEVKKRKELAKQMKRFNEGFASKHKLVVSFQNELGSYLEMLKADIPVSSQNKGLQR